MNKIKVLHLKNRLFSDGVTVLEFNLAEKLKDYVCFDWLVNAPNEDIWNHKFQEIGSEIYERPFLSTISHTHNPFIHKLHTFKEYVSFFKQHPYNIIHIDTDSLDASRLLFCAFIAGVPNRIIHSHNSRSEDLYNSKLSRIPIVNKLKREIIGLLATDFVACSPIAAKWLFPQRYIKRTLFLKNGIYTNKFRFDKNTREIYRNKLKIRDEFLIGHIGRFAKQKNHHFLVDIFKLVAEQDDNIRLLLIGEGALEKEIQEKVSYLQLENKVIFLGETNEVEKYLCAMDLFVLPSLFEGLGIVNIEAQASGLPCLVSDKVPLEAKITNRFEFLPLTAGKELWANKILFYKQTASNEIREYSWKEVKSAGYDIESSAQILLKFYRTCAKKQLQNTR